MSATILVLFDFDGTLTKRDSFFQFLVFCFGWVKFILGIMILSPTLISYVLKFKTNEAAKEHVFSYFFKDYDLNEFDSLSARFAHEVIPRMLTAKGCEALTWHKEQGHEICVVSASFENYLKPWADKEGLALLATQAASTNGRLTGKFYSRNCYGQEKVKRVKDRYDLSVFDKIYAYGNSKGDAEMLALAEEDCQSMKCLLP